MPRLLRPRRRFHAGPPMISITAFSQVPRGQEYAHRSGAETSVHVDGDGDDRATPLSASISSL